MTECNELDRKLVDGVRADSWRKEPGDEWRAAAWGDICIWRPVKHTPRVSLGVDKPFCLLAAQLICKSNRRSLRGSFDTTANAFRKYSICARTRKDWREGCGRERMRVFNGRGKARVCGNISATERSGHFSLWRFAYHETTIRRASDYHFFHVTILNSLFHSFCINKNSLGF